MAFTPQPEFPIFTLSNGAQVTFCYDAAGFMLHLLVRRFQNDEWTNARGFQLSNPGTVPGFIATSRGGVAQYLAAIIATCNARLKELYPEAFTGGPQVPSMPQWLNGEHPDTVALIQRLFGLKLVNNQLTL